MAQIHLDTNNQLSSTEKWVLFIFGVLFIILPLIFNLVQLHKEIHLWMCDVHSKHTVQPWIRLHLRFLYMIAIFCGSAFSAVDICNSNIFHLAIFNMSLNQRQKAIFKNQRVLSTVLIPQLILQIIYLILTVAFESRSKVSAITIIAMIFSIISITTSLFDYKSSTMFIKCESITVIEMNIESKVATAIKSRELTQVL